MLEQHERDYEVVDAADSESESMDLDERPAVGPRMLCVNDCTGPGHRALLVLSLLLCSSSRELKQKVMQTLAGKRGEGTVFPLLILTAPGFGHAGQGLRGWKGMALYLHFF